MHRHRNSRHLTKALIAGATLAAFAACGSGTKTTKEKIDAAKGGEVSLTGTNKSSLKIPAASLAADLEVTLTHKTSLSGLPALADATNIVVIEPADTQLSKGAAIHIDPEQDLTGKTYRIYRLFSGDGETGWSPLDQSTIVDADGRVETFIDRFGTYALVVKADIIKPGPKGSISGSLFVSSTEQPVVGQTVKLFDGAKEIDSAVSDSKGAFSFAEVPVGSHEIKVELKDSCLSGELSKQITVEADKSASAFFAFQSICD